MSRRSNDFLTIRSEGGLLPPDLLRRVIDPKEKLEGTLSEDYGLPQGERLNEVITQSWNRLRKHWSEFLSAVASLPEGEPATGVTNDKWSLPLLRELGFGLLPTSAGPEIDGQTYAVNRFFGPVPIHLVGCGLSLDRRAAGVRGAAAMNPHGLVQEFLNRSDEHLWAIVSNGLRFRLLRDNQALSRQSFLEFDLEAMFIGEVYSDFVLLWLMTHATRFVSRDGARPESCLLEQWTKIANEQGTRALGELRSGVEKALQILGEGFTSHSKNTDLRESLRNGQITPIDLKGQLLRIVYRLIFLFVAEDRTLDGKPLLHPIDESEPARIARERYSTNYSTARLRDLASKIKGSRHGDLWRQFQIIVCALSGKDDCAAARKYLALPVLGSFLWDPASTFALNDAELTNYDLLEALRHLAFFCQGKVLRPVDYKNLGAEELGGVYESLLALTPQISADGAKFTFVEFAGNERKTSGSYYTPDSLVQCLLDSALDPVVEEAIKGKTGIDAEKAILALKVCDPAVGSGHFLVGAAHRLARHLSRVRALAQGESEPSPLLYQHALRDVIGRCLYGVDISPMSAELCRVSLWLEALEPGKPLSFLDHHIRVGNSLLGATPELISAGIPDEAFNAIEGDDNKACAVLKKRNKAERRGLGPLFAQQDAETQAHLQQAAAALDELPDDRPDNIRAKELAFRRHEQTGEYLLKKNLADVWCAAFVIKKYFREPGRESSAIGITQGLINDLAGGAPLSAGYDIEVKYLSKYYQFFHWHLAYPEVFAKGGFDCVLGNPPWETMSPDAKEFFSSYDFKVRFTKKDEQQRIISDLLKDTMIAEQWAQYRRNLYALVHFMKSSGRYKHMFAEGNLGKGDFDLYRVFIEIALTTSRPAGGVGQVVKSGLYNGANAQGLRKELFNNWELNCVYGFLNTSEYWFPKVHPETRFALYTARKRGHTTNIRTAFGLETVDQLQSAKAVPLLTSVDSIRIQSPVSLAIPETQGKVDSALAMRMQGQWPVFGDASAGEPYRHFQREIDMGTDRDQFDDSVEGLPLMEGRMIDRYDHRAKAYRSGRGRSAVWESLPFGHPGKLITPQWRVPETRIPKKLGNRTSLYRVVWCDVATPTAPRSLIAALVPPNVICGDTCPTLRFPDGYEWAYMPWLAVANSFSMDFLARRKISLHLKYTQMDSLPFPRFLINDEFVMKAAPLALQLTCTSKEMTDYWNMMCPYGWCEPIPTDQSPPGCYEISERHDLICRIDALVAHYIFRHEMKDIEFVLDSFEAFKKSEIKTYGKFKTKLRILECFEQLIR